MSEPSLGIPIAVWEGQAGSEEGLGLYGRMQDCEWQGSHPHPQSPCPGKHGALAVGALHPVCDSRASTSVSSWPQFLGIHTKAASSLARLPEAAPDHPLPTQQRHGPWPYPHIPQPQIQAWERPPKCQASGFDHKLAGPQTQAPSQGGTNRTPGL